MTTDAQVDWLSVGRTSAPAKPKRRRSSTAADRRDAAILRAGERAERSHGQWCHEAAEFLRRFGRDTALGQPFLVEDAVAAAPLELKPAEPRAWGAALRYAANRGWLAHALRNDGTRDFGVGRTNLSPKPRWVAPAEVTP